MSPHLLLTFALAFGGVVYISVCLNLTCIANVAYKVLGYIMIALALILAIHLNA